MLEVDQEQLTFLENRRYKFELIQLKRYHDEYMLTPHCPFKKKEVQETWFHHEKASISHFLHCVLTMRERLESTPQTLSSIIFLYHYLKYPLQSLMLIYRFRSVNTRISSYPSMILQIIQSQIKSTLRQFQTERLRKCLEQNDILNHMSVFQYYRSNELFEEYIGRLRPLLEEKIRYWERLINGYDSLESLKRDLIRVTQKAKSVENFIEKHFNARKLCYRINFHQREEDYAFEKNDIIVLKLLQLNFSYVANDFRKVR